MNTEETIILITELADTGNFNNILEAVVNILDEDSLERILLKKKQPRVRSQLYYEVTVEDYSLDEFKSHFRMSRSLFESLLRVVANKAMELSEPIANIPMDKKMLFTIWLLAKQESFLSVGDRFDIAKSSGHRIFQFVVHILAGLASTYIKWPTNLQQLHTAEIFEEKSRGIPGVIGAIDGCHIPIKQPVGNAHDFYYRKQVHSIVLQGVCDNDGKFIDVFVGQPGRMHDARRNRKMRKHKNSVQDEIFLKFMEKQPDIARGFTKGDRIAVDSKWAALAADLNDAGPPTKNVLGWKKVWSDWKGAIRKKLAHNRRETSATGGGPYAQLALSDAEQTVATLCGLYKMIEGDVARAFGVPDTDDAKSPLFSSIGTKRPAEDAPEALASSPSTESAAKRVRRAPVNNLEEICGASNRF
ncbi:hypothetical protein ACLKA6_007768 [Drosophila palustris]